MRSPPRRGMVQRQTECSSDRSKTFACDFPQGVFLASDTRQCSRDATVKSEREFLEVVENTDPWEDRTEIRRGDRRTKSPAHWMIVNTLTKCLSGWKPTSERGGTGGRERPQPQPGQRESEHLLRRVSRTHSRGAVE